MISKLKGHSSDLVFHFIKLEIMGAIDFEKIIIMANN